MIFCPRSRSVRTERSRLRKEQYVALFGDEARRFASYGILKRAARSYLRAHPEEAVPYLADRRKEPEDAERILRRTVRDRRVSKWDDPTLQFRFRDGSIVREDLAGKLWRG